MKKKEARKKCKRFDFLVHFMIGGFIGGFVLSIFFAFFNSKLCIFLSMIYGILCCLCFGVLVYCSLIIYPSYRGISRKHVFEGDPEEEVDEDDMDFL